MGLMVNYLYDLKRLDKHRSLLAQSKIPVSRDRIAVQGLSASRLALRPA
jgi:hypothetical protein